MSTCADARMAFALIALVFVAVSATAAVVSKGSAVAFWSYLAAAVVFLVSGLYVVARPWPGCETMAGVYGRAYRIAAVAFVPLAVGTVALAGHLWRTRVRPG